MLVCGAFPAGATGTASLVSHQLPLEPQSHSLLQLTANGLLAAGGHTAAPGAASTAALQALEKQHPPTHQHVEALRATLSEVSGVAGLFVSRQAASVAVEVAQAAAGVAWTTLGASCG